MTQRIALITGGSRGLGRSAALHLARQGVDSIITYLSRADEAARVVADIEALGARAVALKLDVSDSSSFDAFVAEVTSALAQTWHTDQLHYLVNNAGVGIRTSFEETTEAQFDTQMAIHLKAPFFLSQKLVPFIARGGHILNVSSGLARFTHPGVSAYGTMKAGVEMLTRYMARELGPRGIRVNVIAPGPIATDFGGGQVRDNAAINQALAAQTALGRVGEADDIGSAMALLLSDASGWINGQRIEASGGIFL